MSGQGPYSPQNLVQKGAELKRQDPSGWSAFIPLALIIRLLILFLQAKSRK
jgi:hypothetical protein